MRVEAPNGGCWSATIGDDAMSGCGSRVIAVSAQGSLRIFAERLGPPEQPVMLIIELDGRVVQTIGPTTAEYPTLDLGYWTIPPSG